MHRKLAGFLALLVLLSMMQVSPAVQAAGGLTVFSQNTVLGQKGTAAFAGIYEYDNLVLTSGVQLTTSGISQLVLVIKDTLTIGKGAAIRVRNGYYPNAPETYPKDLTASAIMQQGIAMDGYQLYPGLYGRGGKGGDGGYGNAGFWYDRYNCALAGAGGSGGGGGYGGGLGGSGGKGAYGYTSSGTKSYSKDGQNGQPNGGNAGSSGPMAGRGGYATGLGGNGDSAYENYEGGSGGGGNGGDGGVGGLGSTYTRASGRGGGGGGYGGGVLTIIAPRIVIEDPNDMAFVVSGQAGGSGDASLGAGENGGGGVLLLYTDSYAVNTKNWTAPYGNASSVRVLPLTAYGGGHSNRVVGAPGRVFINDALILTGNEAIPPRIKKPVSEVTLSKSSLELPIGGKATLTATVAPADAYDKSITWATSDATIVTVNSGALTAGSKPGSATITAIAASGVRGQCVVTVLPDATAVAVSPETVTIRIGETIRLKGNALPANASNKTLTWRSDNDKIATVTGDGTVKGVAAGTAVIMALTTNQKVGACVVTVKANTTTPQPTVQVTGVRLSKTKATIAAGLQVTLKASISPAGAGNKALTWKSSNTKIAKVDANGVVTGIKKGKATITATAQDGSKKQGKCTVTVETNAFARKKALKKPGKLITSAKSIQYKGSKLSVTMYYNNQSKKAVAAGGVGKSVLVYNRSTGKKVFTLTIPAARRKRASIKPKKTVTLTYTFSLKNYPELKGLDLRKLDAVIK